MPAPNPNQTPAPIILNDEDLKQLWDFNFTNHRPTGAAIRKIEALRSAAKAMKDAIIDLVPGGRERALALTSQEQTLFYAVAGIARRENVDAAPADDTPEEDKALAAEKSLRGNDQPGEQPAPPATGESRVVEEFEQHGARYQKTVSDTATTFTRNGAKISEANFKEAWELARTEDASADNDSTNNEEKETK